MLVVKRETRKELIKKLISKTSIKNQHCSQQVDGSCKPCILKNYVVAAAIALLVCSIHMASHAGFNKNHEPSIHVIKNKENKNGAYHTANNVNTAINLAVNTRRFIIQKSRWCQDRLAVSNDHVLLGGVCSISHHYPEKTLCCKLSVLASFLTQKNVSTEISSLTLGSIASPRHTCPQPGSSHLTPSLPMYQTNCRLTNVI